MIQKLLLLVVFSFVFTACLGLQTRRDIGVNQASEAQQKQAAQNMKEDELGQSIRELTGKVETLEYKLNQSGGAETVNLEKAHKRIDVIDERLKNIENALVRLEQQLKIKSTVKAKAPKKKKSIYDNAQNLFQNKKWEEAILEYNKYRETYPKGRWYADSTYKIAVCFQELKQVEDAKAFYQEVVENFPKTKAAKRSKYRLNQLK